MESQWRHSTGVFIATVSLLSIFQACGGTAWKEVSSLAVGDPPIVAGQIVQIEPVHFEPAEIAGDELSINEFEFAGTLLDTTSDLTLRTNVTLLAGSGRFRSDETQSGTEALEWVTSEPSMAVEFQFFVVGRAYSGKGYLYFYLTDANGKCVSNIVGWPVEFK